MAYRSKRQESKQQERKEMRIKENSPSFVGLNALIENNEVHSEACDQAHLPSQLNS